MKDAFVLDDKYDINSCIVFYNNMPFRYSNLYRFQFDNDAEFLEDIEEDLKERIENELKYQSV